MFVFNVCLSWKINNYLDRKRIEMSVGKTLSYPQSHTSAKITKPPRSHGRRRDQTTQIQTAN